MTASSNKRNKLRNAERETRNYGIQNAVPRAPHPASRTTHYAFRIPHSAWPWLGLMALALAAYLPALRAGFLWDDDVVTQSQLVSSWDGLWKIWTPPSLAPREAHYWPLVYTSFWLEWRLWGAHPFGYHLTNILLHGLCGVLLWRVLRKLDVPGAWIGAALFVVHPVHVESVAWVIERKDVLSGALFLGVVLAYLRFECGMRNAECGIKHSDSRIQNEETLTPHSAFQVRSRGETSRPHSVFYALAVLLFAGALLCKSSVVGLPLALAILIWYRRGRLGWHDAALLGGMAALAAAVTLADLKFMKGHLLEVYDSGLSWTERVLLAARAVWFYLLKNVWPHPLAPFYPKWDVNPARVMAWLPLLAGIGLLAGLWAARRRIGRGPLAAALFFILMLGPALGFIDHGFMNYSWVADRFQYLASAGPLVLAAALLARLAGLAPSGAKQMARLDGPIKKEFYYLAAAVIAVLGVMCFRRAALYKDSVTLYSAAAKAYPQCWGAHYVRGFGMLQRGDDANEALQSLAEAMRLHPDFLISNIMGQVQTVLQRYPEAEASLKKTLELKPDHGEAHNSYGVLLVQMGRMEEAIREFKEALRLEPDNAKAMAGLGVALKNRQQYAEAEGYLAEAARREPQNAEFQKELGIVLAKQGRNAEAEAAFDAAIALEPNNSETLAGLGYLALNQQQAQKAAGYFERSLAINPAVPQYLVELGKIYAGLGRTQEAAGCFREALRLEPASAPAAEQLRALNGK